MISHEHKFIFIHIPKCGGTSIERFFKMKLPRQGAHLNLKYYKKNTENYETYFKFTIVRNPWDKMVSEYKWMTEFTPVRSTRKYFKDMSFPMFLSAFHGTSVGDGHHRKSYYHYLNPISDIDYVARFENYDNDVTAALDKLNIPNQQLPHKNKSKHKHYTEYYDEETKQIVAEKYAWDIEYFGYEFGD